MIDETVAVAEETKKKGRKPRDKHPAALGDGSLTEMPGDYGFGIQAGLVEKDFAEEWQFLTYRASEARYRAEKFTAEAVQSKSLGNRADRKKAKRLVKMRDGMQELMDSLRKQGVDVDSILKTAPAAA